MRLFFTLSSLLLLASCNEPPLRSQPQVNFSNTLTQTGLPISLNKPELKVCKFKQGVQIAHFPMIHRPSVKLSNAQNHIFEQVTYSQFQLLHTILFYKNNLALFDETVTNDEYNRATFSQLVSHLDTTEITFVDGTTYYLQERYDTATSLFQQSVPQYYEHLSPAQKHFIFSAGGALTAYLLGQITNIYKIIPFNDFKNVQAQLNLLAQSYGGLKQLLDLKIGMNSTRDYWLYTYRENKAQREIVNFLTHKPGFTGLILLAYGAKHDFSDDFAGFSFETGNHCNSWINN